MEYPWYERTAISSCLFLSTPKLGWAYAQFVIAFFLMVYFLWTTILAPHGFAINERVGLLGALVASLGLRSFQVFGLKKVIEAKDAEIEKLEALIAGSK